MNTTSLAVWFKSCKHLLHGVLWLHPLLALHTVKRIPVPIVLHSCLWTHVSGFDQIKSCKSNIYLKCSSEIIFETNALTISPLYLDPSKHFLCIQCFSLPSKMLTASSSSWVFLLGYYLRPRMSLPSVIVLTWTQNFSAWLMCFWCSHCTLSSSFLKGIFYNDYQKDATKEAANGYWPSLFLLTSTASSFCPVIVDSEIVFWLSALVV